MSIELLSPEETTEVLKKLRQAEGDASNLFGLRGEFSAVCREAKTGEEVWSFHRKNTITDIVRYHWHRNAYDGLRYAIIVITPNTENPDPRRISVGGDNGSTCSDSNWLDCTGRSSVEHSHWYSYVFPTPSVNRSIATIGVNLRNSMDWRGGAYYAAYSLVTPPKMQSTTQTLEVTYKLFLQPIS